MNKLKEINGKFYQECEVVMLATDKTSNLILEEQRLVYCKESRLAIINGAYNQHLYFLNNEEIKEGDWCINNNHDTIYQPNCKGDLSGWKKIVATTDTSLKISRENSHPNSIWKLDGALLPQPSKEFIKAFIEAYNSGNPITKVLVEYEAIGNWRHAEFVHTNNILKVNSFNEITIKKVKDSWAREEVRQLINSFGDYHKINWLNPMTKEWIKHNDLD